MGFWAMMMNGQKQGMARVNNVSLNTITIAAVKDCRRACRIYHSSKPLLSTASIKHITNQLRGEKSS